MIIYYGFVLVVIDSIDNGKYIIYVIDVGNRREIYNRY